MVDERQLAVKAILDLDHIPAGMEAFPAVDMEQFEYIKKVIDECDYYLLIIGARYGSTDSEGVSYTEREYDYAISTGKTVIAIIHNDVGNLPAKHVDTDPVLKEKLDAFREKVKKGRIRFWKNHDQLMAAMMQAIVKAIDIYPAVGWIRGDTAASDDVLQKFMQLSADYDELLAASQDLMNANSAAVEGLASLGEEFTVRYRYKSGTRTGIPVELKLTWADYLKIVGPHLLSPTSPATLRSTIRSYMHDRHPGFANVLFTDMDIDTIKMHFAALGLLQIRSAKSTAGGIAEYIQLTDKGKSELMKCMAVRSKEGAE